MLNAIATRRVKLGSGTTEGAVPPGHRSTAANAVRMIGMAGLAAAGVLAAPGVWALDVTAPRIASITRLNPTAQETNADTVSWRVTFNEAVTGLSADDFTLTQTTATLAASNITATSVDLTASGGDLATLDGGAVLGIAGSQNITDSAGNALTNTNVVGTNDNSFNIDNTPPNVDVIFTDDSASSANSLVVWDISFFENHTGLLISHFDVVTTGTVTVSNLQIVQDNGTNVQVSANLTGDGTAQLTLLPNAPLVDDVGNGNGTNGFTSAYTDTQFSVATVDNTAPTINLFKAGAGSPFTTDPELSIFFSEDVTGFTVDDIVVSGATLSGFRANNARVYFVTVNRVNDGPFTVDIAANVATDGVGNPNTAATQFQGAFDTMPPTAVLSTSATAPVTDTFTINIDFSEDVTGLSEGDFTVVNGSTNNLTGGPRAYTMEIWPTFGAAGSLTVDLGAGSVQDTAELDNTASNQLTVAFDREAPTLTSIVRQTPAGAAIGSSTSSVVFRATFSEDVTNVDVADWEIRRGGGGVIASVTPVSARVYDITYTLQTASGIIELGITQSGNVSIADTAGNGLVNEEATGTTETYERDTQAPVTTSVVSDTAGALPTASDTLTWTVTFNEDMANASADDFAVTGTTAAITNVSTPTARTVTVTASGGDLAGLTGTVTLGLSAGSDLSDAVGNTVASLANSGTDQRAVSVDNTGPTLSVTGPTSTVSAAFSVTVLFDEDVTGFTIDDIAVGNGTASNFVANSARFYTATITPAASGNVTIDVAANAASDTAGNGSSAATRLTVGADLVAPTVTSITPFDPFSPTTNSDTLMWRVDFSESVENVWIDDFAVTGTTATVTLVSTQPPAGGLGTTAAAAPVVGAARFNPSLSGNTFYVSASGGDLASVNGSVTLGFAVIQDIADEAGNALANTTPATNGSTYTLDNTAPVLNAFARQTPATSQTDADTLVFDVRFSENVANVSADDFDISGTTATGVLGGTGAAYTLTLSGGDLANLNGLVGLDLAAGQNIVDAAGNPLPAGEPATDEAYNVLNDAVAPRIVSILRAAPTTLNPTGSDSLHWEIRFDESVTGVDAADFSVTGTTATVTAVTATASASAPGIDGPASSGAAVYAITVSGGDLADLDGTVSLAVAATQNITDVAGNALVDTTPTGANVNVFTVDNTGPTATITSAAGAQVNTAFAVTIAFDEPVSGFTLSDLQLVNATASDLVTRTGDWTGWPDGYVESVTFTVTPAADGTVTVDLAAGAATDLAGNGTLAARQFQVTADATAPRVASILRNAPTTLNPTGSDSLHWLVRFDEDVDQVDASDFTVSGTTATVTSVTPQAVALPPSVIAGAGQTSWPSAVLSSSAFELTVSGGDLADLNGTVTLGVAVGQDIVDAAGNALANTTPTGANVNAFIVDNAGPAVAVTTGAAARVNGTFTVTVRFREPVTGFELADVRVSNGAASNLVVEADDWTGWPDGYDERFTITITPADEGEVTVSVAAGAAQDLAGNGNLASNLLSVENDTQATLSVRLPGVGAGSVASSPAGISCGTDCTEIYPIGSVVTLTASAESGSTFAGWTAGPCVGSAAANCDVTLDADATIAARFTLDTPPAGRIVAAILPGARSGRIGGGVMSAFLSVVSRNASPAQGCRLSAPAGAPVTANYQEVDVNNQPTGPADPLFDIPAGGSLRFVLSLTPTATTPAAGYEFLPVITCENASLDPIVGVSSLLLNIDSQPVPDVLSAGVTPSGDGVIRIANPGGAGVMSASALNIGAGDGSAGPNQATITVTADTGAAALPVAMEVCQIDATTAQCLAPRAASVTVVFDPNVGYFFAVFVRDQSAGGIPFDPANSRVFLRFADATGALRSSTSAAVTAPAPAGADVATALPEGRWSVLMRQADHVWPGLQRASLFVAAQGEAIVANGDQVRRARLQAQSPAPESPGRFTIDGRNGMWTADGAIRLGGAWSDLPGEFWGVSDTRSAGDATWRGQAGRFGEAVVLTDAGELRGRLAGCALFGTPRGFAGTPMPVTLSGCAAAGEYLAVIDLPANDNELPALLVAGVDRGWRLTR